MKKVMYILILLLVITTFLSAEEAVYVRAGNPPTQPPGTQPSPEDCYNPCNWPSYRGDNFNTAYQEPDCSPQCLDEKGALQLIWRKDTIGSTYFPPSLDFGRTYVCDGAGFTYCFDAFNGTEYWKVGTGYPIHMAPALHCTLDANTYFRKRIFYGDDFGNFYCRDAITGTLIWKTFVDNPILCSPKVYKGRVFFATDCGQVYCYDANANVAIQNWMYDIGSAMIRATFAVGFDRLWFGASDNKLYCLDNINGTVPSMAFGWPVATGNYVESAPVYDNGYIYYCATNIYCFNAFFGGALPFTVNSQGNFITHPSIDMSTNNIYAGIEQKHILKLNTPDLTAAPGPTAIPVVYKRLTSPSTTDQTAFASTTDTNKNDHFIYIFRNWTTTAVPVDAPKGETLSSIAIAYQNLYFCRDSCGVYCYGCRCEKTYTITILPEYVCLELNQNNYASFQFTALVYDEKGNLVPTSLTWSVTPIPPSIPPAVITGTGLFTTYFKGKWKITASATIGGKFVSGHAVVEVK